MAPDRHRSKSASSFAEPAVHEEVLPRLGLIAGMAVVGVVIAAYGPSAVNLAGSTAIYFGLAVLGGSSFKPRLARSVALALCGGLTLCLHLGGADSPWPVGLIFGATMLAVVEGLSRVFSRLRVDATTDALTGLRNRLGLREECNRAIAVCRRMNQPLSIVHIDLDGFKEVNDSAGHAEGDRILIRCAEAWRREMRAGDILARIGGDEFLAVLPGSDHRDAEGLVQRLLAVSPIDWCSGIAQLEENESFASGLARADRELYAAKGARGSRVGRRGGSLRAMRTRPDAIDVRPGAGAAFG